MFLTVLIPVFAYNNIPEWVYYLTPGTRLWIITEEINSAYENGELLDALSDAEKRYDTNIEITTADGRFVYSTLAIINYLPDDLSKAPEVDEGFRLNYETAFGNKNPFGKGYLIKRYSGKDYEVSFLDCYVYLESGDCVDVYIQVSNVSSTTRISFVAVFVAIMLTLVFALVVISRYIDRMIKPVKEMVKITENMAGLDFSEKCPSSSIYELNSLSESINEMSSALDSALGDLQTQNKKLAEDIENERTIDNLRKTFISGISHELKTPIAIIQGYAEGAKLFYSSGNAEAADNYCDIIVSESTRMNEMIMKLLEITKYSSGAYDLAAEDFDICCFAQDWFERNEEILKEKGIEWENNIEAGLYGNGDKIILSSVLNNYLSNAVSHAEREKIIKVRLEDMGETYRVFVFNTGKPIAEKDIDKIWDSFYRADKSLSRSQGRFGLGLSIVSAIQDLHKQEYGVNNLLTGVEFWFDIKKAQKSEQVK
ncbi:MAG: HAMP domain-containing histidine kinase [Oscillospiraceae bacterium]|nr:HAMP domain-containing histidine kinase [Oscillospiraceae bacterium]